MSECNGSASGDARHSDDLRAAMELWERRREGVSSALLKSRRAIARHHVQELYNSGLNDATIRTGGFRTVEGDEVTAALKWKGGGEGLGRCLLIPFFDRDGRSTGFGRLKPDNPRSKKDDDDEDQDVKYEQPKGEPIRVYFPPGVGPLLDDRSLPLVIVEGEKKACAVRQAGYPCIGLTGVWCFLDTSEKAKKGKGRGRKKKALHPDLKAEITSGRRVLVVFDTPDIAENAQVRKAARALVGLLNKAGAVATVLQLPENPNGGKVGADDFIVANGPGAFRTLVEAAPPPQPAAPARPAIVITADEFVINDLAIAALSREPNLYSRGGYLVRVLRDRPPNAAVRRAAGAPRIAAVQAATLREDLTRVLEWRKINQHGEEVPAHPPKWCYDAVHARGEWPGIRPLAGVVECPVVRPDGSILGAPGYDPCTGLLYEPSAEFPPVPEKPSKDDARRAVKVFDDLVSEFPFVGGEHRAVWLAGLLTVFARAAFTGPAPLFLFEASAAGSGKTLLVEVNGIITMGREPPVSELSNDNEEVRKAITSILLEGERMVLLDNAHAYLGCAALDAVLTATSLKGRVLGKTQRTADLPADTVWFASGNNVALRGDTHRRVLPCRLEPLTDKPEERTGFKIPDLKAHVREHRPELVMAALTILRAFCVAGRPQAALPAFGSYEGWSALVRQAVVWATGLDPCRAREAIDPSSKGDASALAAVFSAWSKLPRGGAKPGHTAKAALDLVKQRLVGGKLLPSDYPDLHAALGEFAKDGADLPTVRVLANRLRAVKGRVAGGWKLRGEPDSHSGVSSWWVEQLGAGKADTCTPVNAVSADSAVSVSSPFARERNGHQNNTRNKERLETDTAESADTATAPDRDFFDDEGVIPDLSGPWDDEAV